MATALIFDSGVGGLSILQAVSQRLPQLSVVYASDNAAFPYGTKDADWLQQRVVECVSTISQRCILDIIIIACNTASTIVLPSLRDCFEIPIVGVVPAIKTAAQETKTGCIGLLATPGTVTRHYTNQLIQDFASHCQIVKIGSTELVELAEQKLRGEQICLTQLKAVIQPLILQTETHQTQSLSSHRPDQVVLGCTHFPLLKQELEQLAPGISWVDSGIAIANRVASLLLTGNDAINYSLNSENHQSQATGHTALFTEANQQISRLIPALKQFGIEEIDYLNLPV